MQVYLILLIHHNGLEIFLNSLRKNIIVLIIFTATVISAQELRLSQKETFTAEDVRNSGIISLNDIFELSDRWITSGINGYNLRAVGNMMSLFARQNYLVLVDGQKMQLNFLDEQNIDLLPFTADQIDTITFVNVPGNYRGYFAKAGLIDIKLKSPKQGFSIDAMQSVGNRIGDPGPYAYTRYRTPNVDKLGYNTGVNIKTSGRNWNLLVNLKYSENFVTEGAISERIEHLSDRQKAYLLGAGTELNYSLLGGKHKVLFAFAQDEDFFFYPLYGNEIPSGRILRHLGLSGRIPLTSSLDLIYNITREVNELARLENSRDLNFDLSVNSTTINLGSVYAGNRLNGYIGIDYTKHDANRSGLGNDEQINFNRLNVNADYKLSERVQLSAGLELLKNNNTIYPGYYFASNYLLSPEDEIDFHVSLSKTGVIEDLNYFTWTKSGIPLLTGTNIDNESNFEFGTRELFTADFSYSRLIKREIAITVTALYRHFNNFYLENHFYNLDESATRFIPELELSSGEFIKVAGGYGKIEFRFTPQLNNSLSYLYQQPLESSTNFNDEWNKFPGHVLTYRLDYKPVRSFGIRAKLNYISETSWREFEYIKEQSHGKYDNELNSKLLFDLSLQKSLWQERLWINLLFKNILNSKDIRNPAGINNGLRFYLTAHVQLESLFN